MNELSPDYFNCQLAEVTPEIAEVSEQIVIDRAKAPCGAEQANVQPL